VLLVMLLWVYIHTGQAWKICLTTVGINPVWIYTQSNITSIIFTWVHYTNTEKIQFMCFYPTSSFGKLHTYALHYPQHNACEFSNDLITYVSDNLTFNDNWLCKVWREFVCTTYHENWIIPPRKHVNKNVQKKLLYTFDDSFRWANKKFRVMSPLK
jgi:hypothetical protein